MRSVVAMARPERRRRGDVVVRLATDGTATVTDDDAPDDDVLAVAPRSFLESHVELAPVAVLAAVGHAHDAGLVVLLLQAAGFVLELAAAEDRFRPGAVTADEISTLANKALDDPMEARALVVEWFFRGFTDALFSSAERAEVLAGPGGLGVEEVDDESSGEERGWLCGPRRSLR